MYRKTLLCFAASLILANNSSAQGRMPGYESYQPANIDLAKLVECKYKHNEFFDFSWVVVGNSQEEKKLKWRKLTKKDSYISIYELKQPISAFGFQTNKIAFEGMRALAVLETVSTADLAKQFELTNKLNVSYGTLFTKTLNVETDNHPTLGVLKRVTAMVVTDKPDQRGKTFLGCDYDYQD